jgi:hypothetical protein
MQKNFLSAALAAALFSAAAAAATANPVVVKEGVMQWQDGSEVALFGVNYSAPFAYGYRSIERLGVDHRAAIDMDVDHIARLGLDAYRVHLWDRLLADKEGNLQDNIHLQLFDYLLLRLKEKGIKVIITPIGWWGSGYPEPDPVEHGFSAFYSKSQMNQSADAIAAQKNYLTQLFKHVNPLTGKSYQQDPNIIAFEIFNEPKHEIAPAQSAAYIEDLISTIRAAGVTKPLFYNTSEQGNDQPFAKALCNTSIDGVSYQWYPTGLIKGSVINATMLPAVAHYTNPFAGISQCASKAKMVYEFDAADVASSVMYPAMARSFREAGFQWATQFAYDAAAVAHTNSEYNTHHLNLLYTPSKAISLKIAAEVFRTQKRAEQVADYPQSNSFGAVTLDYQQNLSVLNTATQFFYTNSTNAEPKDAAMLSQIAGVGSSVVANYSGSGAYFLDKVADGVWRLEVYPDVLTLQDPYQNSSLSREVGRLYAAAQQLKLTLSDLGKNYQLQGLNSGNTATASATDGKVTVRPGVYLLTAKAAFAQQYAKKVETDFYLPKTQSTELALVHQNQRQMNLGDKFSFVVDIGAVAKPAQVQLMLRYLGDNKFTAFEMQASPEISGRYQLAMPKDWTQTGLLEYAFVVTANGKAVTFPGAAAGSPLDWDFVSKAPYWTVAVKPQGQPVALFDASLDRQNSLYPKDAIVTQRLVADSSAAGLALQLGVTSLETAQAAALLKTTLSVDNSLLHRNLTAYNTVALKIRAVKQPEHLSFAVLDKDGIAYGTELKVGTDWQYLLVPLKKLKATQTLLTQAYPMFMPVFAPKIAAGDKLKHNELSQLQGLQLMFNQSAYSAADAKGWHGVELAEVSLIQKP